MSEIKTITVTRGGTLNKGNFNNIKFEVSATVEVAPGDDADKVYEKTRAWVHERAKREAETP